MDDIEFSNKFIKTLSTLERCANCNNKRKLKRFKVIKGKSINLCASCMEAAKHIKQKERQSYYYENNKESIKEAVTSVSPVQKMMYRARSRANKKKVPFSVHIEDINKVWPIDDICPICFASFVTANPASLDRIIPSLGYVIGNIVVICNICNKAKSTCTDPDRFIKIGQWLQKALRP